MPAPPGGEVATLQSRLNHADLRVAMTIVPRLWTEERLESFDTALSPEEFWYTQYGGDSPLVTGGALVLRSYGGPPRELVITRPHWFPRAADKSFRVDMNITFPQTDPVYNAVVTVGGIEQNFADIGEPLRVIQKGSVYSALAGNIFVDGLSDIDNVGVANDQSVHTYSVMWRPAASGVGSGNHKLTVLRDGVIMAEGSDDGFAVQPRYIAIGMIQNTRLDADENVPVALGTPDSPATLIQVHNIAVYELGDGYEEVTYPAWTSPDVGGTLTTAGEGERFTQDGLVWAKLPVGNILNWEAKQSRLQSADTFRISLDLADYQDETNRNRFAGQYWHKRIVTIDTRVVDDTDPLAPAPTGWYRLMCGEVEHVSRGGGAITLAGRERAMLRLDTFISRSYISLGDEGDETDGQVEGTNIGYTITAVLQDLFEVSEAVAGGLLSGLTDTDIQGPDVTPAALSSGGQSLAATFTEICDRLVFECWREYEVSGAGRYGRLRVNGWTFGALDDTPAWTLRGNFAGGIHDIERIDLNENQRNGAGGAYYRGNTPVVGEYGLSLESLPTVGTFPSAPFPPNDRVLNDSLAYLEGNEISPIVEWVDKDGGNMFGGVAFHRYRRENAMRRQVAVQTYNQPFWRVTDIAAIDDPYDTEIVSTERWVVNGVTYGMRDRRLQVDLDLVTVDWVDAILRMLP